MRGKAAGYVLLKGVIICVLLNYIPEIINMVKQGLALRGVCSSAQPRLGGCRGSACTSVQFVFNWALSQSYGLS